MNTISLQVFSTKELSKCFQDIKYNTIDQTLTFSNILPSLSFSEMTSSPSTKSTPFSSLLRSVAFTCRKLVLLFKGLWWSTAGCWSCPASWCRRGWTLFSSWEDMQATHQIKIEQMSSGMT